MSDDALIRGARDAHRELDGVDDALAELFTTRDLHERLVSGTAAVVETTAADARQRWGRMRVAMVVLALLWTPTTAYAAVWTHEVVRNTCYGAGLPGELPVPLQDHWYCGMFPGTTGGLHQH
jgi:hypothetical protein